MLLIRGILARKMLMSGRLLVEGEDDELHFDLSSSQWAQEM